MDNQRRRTRRGVLNQPQAALTSDGLSMRSILSSIFSRLSALLIDFSLLNDLNFSITEALAVSPLKKTFLYQAFCEALSCTQRNLHNSGKFFLFDLWVLLDCF